MPVVLALYKNIISSVTVCTLTCTFALQITGRNIFLSPCIIDKTTCQHLLAVQRNIGTCALGDNVEINPQHTLIDPKDLVDYPAFPG